MGLNTTIVLLNDHLHELTTHPDQFTAGIYARIQARDFGGAPWRGAVVVSCEHADAAQLIRVGGNTGTLLHSFTDRGFTDIDLIRHAAREHGYDLRRRAK